MPCCIGARMQSIRYGCALMGLHAGSISSIAGTQQRQSSLLAWSTRVAQLSSVTPSRLGLRDRQKHLPTSNTLVLCGRKPSSTLKTSLHQPATLRLVHYALPANPLGSLRPYGPRQPVSKALRSPAQSQQTPCRKPSQPEPERQDPPRPGSTLDAVNVMIGINIVALFFWIDAVWAVVFDMLIVYFPQLPELSDPIREFLAQEKCRKMRWMTENTTISWTGLVEEHRYWTVFTNAFSHILPPHVAVNVVLLRLFTSRILHTAGAGATGIGAAHVLGLAMGGAACGGVIDTVHTHYWLFKNPDKCGLGASCVVASFATAATCVAPLKSVFPRRFPSVKLYHLIIASTAIEIVCLGDDDGVGHAGHLAGAAWGIMYYLVALRRFGGISQMVRVGK